MHWNKLTGGYRTPFDPRPLVEELRRNPSDSGVWSRLWDELHHQGEVGEASYAAVSLIVRACAKTRGPDFYSLIATIESRRGVGKNPPVPQELSGEYEVAIEEARKLALQDLSSSPSPELTRFAMAVVALATGARKLGELLNALSEDDVVELLRERF